MKELTSEQKLSALYESLAEVAPGYVPGGFKTGEVSPLGTHETLASWLAEVDEDHPMVPQPMVEMVRYGQLLERLPDGIVENLEKSRAARDGRIQMLKMGGGTYSECISSVIVDGTAIASSAAEARLVPALAMPINYLQPGGLPGRTLRAQLRGRMTTLTTAATLTGRWRDGATDAFTNQLAASGALIMDTTIQTASQWVLNAECVTRTVGSAGTLFVQGRLDTAAAALTIASQQNEYMGSAGANTPAAVTIDLTVARYFNWTAQWSLATAYSITAHQAIIETLN